VDEHEVALGPLAVDPVRRVERVHDGDECTAAGLENARELAHRPGHVDDVH